MKQYVGVLVAAAEPQKHADGREGFTVLHPDGFAGWMPADTFAGTFREITWHERQLLEQSDAEHQVSAISDGRPHDPERDVDR